MSDKWDDDDILNACFAEMRADAPVPSQALLVRIAADAQREQSRPAPVKAPKRSGFSWLRDLPGRMALAGGLTAATVAGVWIGYSPPAALDVLGETFLGSDLFLTEQMNLALDSFYLFEG